MFFSPSHAVLSAILRDEYWPRRLELKEETLVLIILRGIQPYFLHGGTLGLSVLKYKQGSDVLENFSLYGQGNNVFKTKFMHL